MSGDLDGAAKAILDEIDRLELHAAIVTDQPGMDETWHTTGLTAYDLGQGVALIIVGRLVDDPGKQPVAISHDPARSNDEREFHAVKRNSTESTLVDAERHQGNTVVVSCRPLRVGINARAQVITVAAFNIIAAYFPVLVRHGGHPIWQRILATGRCALV